VASTRHAIRAIESANADGLLIGSVLAARSDAEATAAFSLLRNDLDDSQLLAVVNVREVIHEIPAGRFRTGEGLCLLEKAAGYEPTGRSYRRVFDGAHGVFGVEFLGVAHDCEGIVMHTPQGRVLLGGDGDGTVDSRSLALLLNHTILLDAIIEALELLGYPLAPAFYVSTDDFLAEHSADTMGAAFADLF
jgi:hypothetical protein